MNKKEDLVSIRVSAYNSSDTILETLQSIYNQTYSNIELIISDDCSTDDTVIKCEKWLQQYQDRFERSIILESPVNTGIPSNINRALKEVKGTWVKGIAADDILMPSCIESFIGFVKANPEAKFIGANMYVFHKCISNKQTKSAKSILKRIKFANLATAHQQWKRLLKSYCIYTPSLFFKTEIYKQFLYDEKYRYLEDYPFALKILKAGIKYYHLNDNVVLYRISYNSTHNKNLNNKIFNKKYLLNRDFQKEYRTPYMTWVDRADYYYDFYLKRSFDNKVMNRRGSVFNALYWIFDKLNIFHIISKYS